MHRQGSLELRVVRASMGFLLTNRGKGSDVREREESTGKEEGAQVRVTAWSWSLTGMRPQARGDRELPS